VDTIEVNGRNPKDDRRELTCW